MIGLGKISFSILIFLAFSFLNSILPVTAFKPGSYVDYNFVVKEATFPKFCANRTVLAVNGIFPGPEIRVHRGQNVRVKVQNSASYGITIHWHGIRQFRNPWSDGPENITQCKIAASKSFTYEVIITDEMGTIWWHAHSDWSRATVHGAFIVLPSPFEYKSPYPSNIPDHTLIFASWYNADLKGISDLISLNGTPPGAPDGYILNGYPGDQFNCSGVPEKTFNLTVQRGKTYLLHIVNAAMHEAQYFRVANHSLTVVARDGSLVSRFSTDYILLFPGQTMDVLLKADQNQKAYYMAFHYFDDSSADINKNYTTGFLVYSNPIVKVVNATLPTLPATDNATIAIDFTSKLKSLYKKTAKQVPRGKVTRINMVVRTDTSACTDTTVCASTTKQSASINRVSFATPKSTSALQAYYKNTAGVYNTTFPRYPPANYANTTDLATQGTEVIEVEYGTPVEIVFQAVNVGPGGAHPMHLHGYSFYQVGMGNGTFDNTTDPATYNLSDPPEVNTVAVFGGGWTAIRFFATNPGVWFMHCHFESHASWGMATVIIVKNGARSNVYDAILGPPAGGLPSCG